MTTNRQDTADDIRVTDLIQKQRYFFSTGATKAVKFRKEQLRNLRDKIKTNEQPILDALYRDVRKPPFEAFMTEIGPVLEDLKDAIRHVEKWAAPTAMKTPLSMFPARSKVYHDPYGVALIISPWNYPFNLLMAPLIGALAAGNCAILKTSPLAPNTSGAIKELLGSIFPEEYVALVQGHRNVTKALLEERFDYIFFTGGATVGKAVYEAAAKYLTPVTLELGGKSPCIVADDADIDITARRLAWGKFVNAGQTCVAPDYLLISNRVKDKLFSAMILQIERFYGSDPQKSEHYARIISDNHFDRVSSLMQGCAIVTGGRTDAADRYIAPTILDDVKLDAPVMQEEIFGPILPTITVGAIEESIEIVNSLPKPLSLYLFTEDGELKKKVLNETSSGGGCINDTLLHVGNVHVPFGGVGMSGMGAYHGQESFRTFSHRKSIVEKSRWLDNSVRYPPYSKYGIKLLRILKG